jgi:hypothetical protein
VDEEERKRLGRWMKKRLYVVYRINIREATTRIRYDRGVCLCALVAVG